MTHTNSCASKASVAKVPHTSMCLSCLSIVRRAFLTCLCQGHVSLKYLVLHLQSIMCSRFEVCRHICHYFPCPILKTGLARQDLRHALHYRHDQYRYCQAQLLVLLCANGCVARQCQITIIIIITSSQHILSGMCGASPISPGRLVLSVTIWTPDVAKCQMHLANWRLWCL